jgi:hypothetical protein
MNLLAGRGRDRQHARPRRNAIEVDRAATALRDTAAEFRTGQVQLVADDPQQRRIGRNVDFAALAVHGNRDHNPLPQSPGLAGIGGTIRA